ncbi:DUF4126 domain-containing protein [Planococcus lenghuensis]|uniref:DUF4126 domain-containing protein n=1 Tax=Planococcus lenghuensis TaxID=2213202 RepID=A0A1Q2L0N2_9BACL|nr:DUF4126 domain-containing protein [Planococcus lenghuensis]AQQ54020.1 hypothetical protein B0X71_13550 [Planococcus lenghuensis]
MEAILAVIVGLALSATAGFRIFTPLLITGLFVRTEWVTLAEGFEWIGSTPALIAFGVATLLEIGVNYLPVLGTFLKMLATPAATVAGILLTASFIGDMDPFVSWSIAIIGGGGIATTAHATTSIVKGVSETAAVSPVVSAMEDGIAIVGPVLIFLVPVLAVIVLAVAGYLIYKAYRRITFKDRMA